MLGSATLSDIQFAPSFVSQKFDYAHLGRQIAT